MPTATYCPDVNAYNPLLSMAVLLPVQPGYQTYLLDRVKGSGDFQERDQRELRPDTDQQYQERVDRTGSGDRCLIHPPSVTEVAFS